MAREVNGYHIQDRIRLARKEAEYAFQAFTENTWQFESQPERPDLDALYEKYLEAESRVSRLATLQDVFNCVVKVQVHGKDVTLAEVLNRLNAAGRAAKLWRLALEAKPSYGRLLTNHVRDKDMEYAIRAKSTEHCLKKMYEAEEMAALYREAHNTGNRMTVGADNSEDLF